MKKIVYILIGLFILCSTNSYGQLFTKRKKGYASPKSANTDPQKNRDAFSRKNKKGPNILSNGSPNTKSKSKNYRNSTSKKNVKRKRQSIFSSKKRTHKSVVSSSRKKGKDANKNSSVGRKSRKSRNRK